MSIRSSLSLVLGAALSLTMTATNGLAQSTPPAKAKPATKSDAKPAAKSGAKSDAKTAATPAVPEGGVPHYIRPETPEQRRDRIGTNEDPGPNPDEKTIFWRYGSQFTIFKVEKEFAKYMPEPGYVRPLAQANFVREIYQENDKYIWVWNKILEPEEVPEESKYHEYSQEHLQYFEELRGEFAPIEPPAAGVRLRFEEASAGLPTTGSWRNGAAVADMNEDGFPDLVCPPQRGPADVPAIFLGDGKGNWKRWNADFPRRFNYGSVVVADFNKDKHLDVAFSIHLTGVAVFLGNGKGQFKEVEGLKDDYFPTRRLVAADVDGDGWMDFVAITEGPVGIGKDSKKSKYGHLRAYLNRNRAQSFEGHDLASKEEFLGGDYLVAANFNGDKFPDFLGASIYFNGTKTLYLSKGDLDYEPLVKGLIIPGRSYYYAMAAAHFLRNGKTDDAIVAYMRDWPNTIDPKLVPTPPVTKISGLDRITFDGGEPTRTPIIRWEGATGIPGVASGDFDGDGNLDVAYAQRKQIAILLGDGAGGFKRADVEGIELPAQRSYDLKIADLNGDRKPDVMVMFESDETTAFTGKNGSVHVYLNRGKAASN
jgi:VCBS repeat protein